MAEVGARPSECLAALYVSNGDAFLFLELDVTSRMGNKRLGVWICCMSSIVGTRSILIFVPRSGTVEAMMISVRRKEIVEERKCETSPVTDSPFGFITILEPVEFNKGLPQARL